MNLGWIKFHRKFLEWEWYQDSKMVHLFIHLLLKANHSDNNWQGVDIKRGQLITSYDSLQRQTKISIRSLRTCINKLKKTGELTIKPTNKYSTITICNYDSYQSIINERDKQNDKPSDKRPTSDRQATDMQSDIKQEDNNIKNGKNDNKEINISFDLFWNLYDKKVGDKTKCEKKWNNLKDSERETIMKTLPEFKKQFEEKRFQPHPYTYLNGARWYDEIILPEKKKMIYDRGRISPDDGISIADILKKENESASVMPESLKNKFGLNK